MDSISNYTAKELAVILPNMHEDSESDITISDSDEYLPSSCENYSSEESVTEFRTKRKPATKQAVSSTIDCSSSTSCDDSDSNDDVQNVDNSSPSANDVVVWANITHGQFTPRF